MFIAAAFINHFDLRSIAFAVFHDIPAWRFKGLSGIK